MNNLNSEIMNLIIFTLIFLVIYFNLIDNSLYLKNFMIVLVIGYFGLVDLKYGLLLLILYSIDLNNKTEVEDFFIWKKIKDGSKKAGKSLSNVFKRKPTPEEEEMTREDFVGLNSISNLIKNSETFKSLKKQVKKGARSVLKSIQEEESIAIPENEEEEEEEEDEIENFESRKKKISVKENIENNTLLNQLKKNDILDSKLENFQGKIQNKLQKINNILSKFQK